MRGVLLFIFLLVFCVSPAQQFPVKELFFSSFTEKKFENFLDKRFSVLDKRFNQDTIINIYSIKTGKKKNGNDSIFRSIETYKAKDHFSFSYFTSSKTDFNEFKKILLDEEFYCGDDDSAATLLFQKRNISVRVTKKEQADTLYSFSFHQADLPSLEKIVYAEDLLQFSSHEYLVSVFGEKNVIRDLYYLSGNDFVRCSVVFPRTNRQAVFLWKDEKNLCTPANVIIGGNTSTGSSVNYDGLIGENTWSSRTGIYSGMSLQSLVQLNKATFKFYGKNSTSPFVILPANNGSLDFKNNLVVLGCLNPNGSGELENVIVDADKILNDNLGIYVLMMVFYPPPQEKITYSNNR